MAIRQLSVFVENKQGSLHEITDTLAGAGINLRSMCVADTSNYGIVRIIADDPDKAKSLLDKEGHAANVRLINAFAVPDQPGGLANVLRLLEGNGVNIEYMYALVTGSDDASIIIKTADLKKAAEVLEKTGVELIAAAELGK